MSTDVVLVQPPFAGDYRFWRAESLALGYLGAACERLGLQSALVDGFLMDRDAHELSQDILALRPKTVLISALSWGTWEGARAVIRSLRAGGFNGLVVGGGWFVSTWPEAAVASGQGFDVLVVGEGESVLADVLKMPRATSPQLIRAPLTSDLSSLPHPHRAQTRRSLDRYGLALVSTSRGCAWGRCSFCSVGGFFENQRRERRPADVADEIAALVRNHGARFVFFTDEDFIGPRRSGLARAIRILEGVRARGVTDAHYAFNCRATSIDREAFARLAELGLESVYVGIESTLDRTLAVYQKGYTRATLLRQLAVLDDLGLVLVPGYIMFERDTTLDEVRTQVEDLRRLRCCHVHFLKQLFVMPGTAIAARYGEDVVSDGAWSRYYIRDPRVELLVRIVREDFLPMIEPKLEPLYAAWHRALARPRDHAERVRFLEVDRQLLELTFDFATAACDVLAGPDLAPMSAVLRASHARWAELEPRIAALGQA